MVKLVEHKWHVTSYICKKTQMCCSVYEFSHIHSSQIKVIRRGKFLHWTCNVIPHTHPYFDLLFFIFCSLNFGAKFLTTKGLMPSRRKPKFGHISDKVDLVRLNTRISKFRLEIRSHSCWNNACSLNTILSCIQITTTIMQFEYYLAFKLRQQAIFFMHIYFPLPIYLFCRRLVLENAKLKQILAARVPDTSQQVTLVRYDNS